MDIRLRGYDGSRLGIEKICYSKRATPLFGRLSFGSDGKMLASASYDKTLKLWDIPGGKMSRTLDERAVSIDSVRFSPDGKLLASVLRDYAHTIQLRDMLAGKPLRSLEGDTENVVALCFTPDGRWLASADKCVKLWEMPLRALAELRGPRLRREFDVFQS
jgi:WD40 repeat protein